MPHPDGVFEPGFGHFANGTRGQPGPVAYSSWILSASVKAAAVQGDFSLGQDFHGRPVVFGDLLVDMVEWWEQRTLQLRTDCIIMNGDHQGNPADMNRTCLDLPPTPGVPYCYTMADGWDAMEGSVSGNGCRPTIGAMMWAEAMAIATVANSTGCNASLATKFQRRAEWVRTWYLDHLWSDKSQFLAVYKQGAEFTGMGGCTDNTRKNLTDSGCCCLKPGTRARTGHYANFSMCPPESVCRGCMCGVAKLMACVVSWFCVWMFLVVSACGRKWEFADLEKFSDSFEIMHLYLYLYLCSNVSLYFLFFIIIHTCTTTTVHSIRCTPHPRVQETSLNAGQ